MSALVSVCVHVATSYLVHVLLGMKLQMDSKYTVTFPQPLHLSSAILCTDGTGRYECDCLIEVHVVVDEQDHVLGILGGGADNASNPILQTGLMLKLQPSVPITFYTKRTVVPYQTSGYAALVGWGPGRRGLGKAPVVVQLTGYFE